MADHATVVPGDATPRQPRDDDRLVSAAQRGAESAFNELVERHRRELHLHCYRMLGSFAEAEDVVQETFLRAWRGLDTFAGRSLFRTWLYRIATNACLDVLRSRPRRTLPYDVVSATAPGQPPPAVDYWSIEPCPDDLLHGGTHQDPGPDAVVVARETIELAFLAAIQHLPTRQRAVLILRDVLGWSAKETGAVLDTSETAVKSALQRARATLRVRLPPGRSDWSPPPQATESELAILRRYIAAHEADDHNALAAVLSEDVRVSYPPQPLWRDSRDSFIASSSQDAPPGEYRFLTTRANNQPAVAIYLRQPEATTFQLIALEVIRIDHDRIVEIVDFDPRLVPASSLPVEL